jgi:hypothetical protein
MKIDPNEFLTAEQAAVEMGAPNKRSLYRAMKRAREAGETVTVELFGRSLIPRAKIEVLKRYYYPYYSDAHQAMVKEWGRRGGAQKWKNAARAAKRDD